jgi:hypothetical protein
LFQQADPVGEVEADQPTHRQFQELNLVVDWKGNPVEKFGDDEGDRETDQIKNDSMAAK